MFMTSGSGSVKGMMTGVGGSALQTYPAGIKYSSVSASFASINELAKASVQKFDARTDPTSDRIYSVISGGRLTPRPNLAPSYEYRLIDRVFDGGTMVVETVISGSPKTLELPSMIVLSAKPVAQDDILGVEFGSNGLRIVSLLGTTIRYEKTIPYQLASGSILRIERFFSWIQIYVNGLRIAQETHPTFNVTEGSPGVGLFSSVAPALSTPIGPTTFYGGSTKARNVNGRADFPRIKLEKSVITPLVSTYIPDAGFFRLAIWDAHWTTGTQFSVRPFSIYLNDTRIGATADQNGTSYQLSARFSVPANSTLEMRAYSDGGENDRTIKSGYFTYYAVP